MVRRHLPDTLCLAPFVQLTTHPTGSFSPCPYLGGTSWLGHKGTIIEKWTGSEMEQLRREFLDGGQPAICQRCWNEEKIGKKSLRQRLYDIGPGSSDYSMFSDGKLVTDTLNAIHSGEYVSGPKIISIKNGNVCNAKCRSCHPEDSSQWIQDANKLHERTKNNFYKIGLHESNWSDDQIAQIRSMAHGLHRIELFGGESLYNKKVLRLLNEIIDDGNSNHISLYVNTNGSVDILEKIPGISSFQDIDIGVSIDSQPVHFSYVRHPLAFDEIADNVRRWRQHFVAAGTPHTIQSISTISILNVYYLPELKQTVIDLLGQSPFWNLLIEPGHLSIANLPTEVKQQVISKIGSDPEFQEFVNFMNKNTMDINHFRNFFIIRDELDEIRRESFSRTFGEWASIINPHRPLKLNVSMFVGDLSQDHAGQYLESVAREHDEQSFLLMEGEQPGTVTVVEPDGWRRTMALQALPPGSYYTGVTKWRDINTLARLLDDCREVVYAPPHIWSDHSRPDDPHGQPHEWSRQVLEGLLEKISDVKTIALRAQQRL